MIVHYPFTLRDKEPFDIENEIYSEWVSLINENICLTVMLSGHAHIIDIIKPQDDKDSYGQLFPVVIGSARKSEYFAGTGLLFDENKTVVTFTDNLGQVVREGIC